MQWRTTCTARAFPRRKEAPPRTRPMFHSEWNESRRSYFYQLVSIPYPSEQKGKEIEAPQAGRALRQAGPSASGRWQGRRAWRTYSGAASGRRVEETSGAGARRRQTDGGGSSPRPPQRPRSSVSARNLRTPAPNSLPSPRPSPGPKPWSVPFNSVKEDPPQVRTQLLLSCVTTCHRAGPP